jgi:cytidylate kinase
MASKKIRPIITIDGPAASGKGTVAKSIANDLNLFYLETGIFYRAIGKLFLVNNKNNIKIFLNSIKQESFFIDKANKQDLYNEEVAEIASNLAKLKEVRSFVLTKQLEMLKHYPNKFKGVIMEGRDCGTVIAPNADVKFFLNAKLEIRAKRRHQQLFKQDKKTMYEKVYMELKARDDNDIARKNSPLVKAEDAIDIDCSSTDIEETIMIVKKIIFSKLPYFI